MQLERKSGHKYLHDDKNFFTVRKVLIETWIFEFAKPSMHFRVSKEYVWFMKSENTGTPKSKKSQDIYKFDVLNFFIVRDIYDFICLEKDSFVAP